MSDVFHGQSIAGYTEQSHKTVDLVNENKRTEERILRLLDDLQGGVFPEQQYDGRWVSIARTHFEQGFMALNRAIFRPTRIRLPEDN